MLDAIRRVKDEAVFQLLIRRGLRFADFPIQVKVCSSGWKEHAKRFHVLEWFATSKSLF
jgi:hypothetical protein